MKIVRAAASEAETSAEIDLFSGLALSKKQKREIAQEVGDYLVEQTLLSVGSQKSPIDGETWKKLISKEYKKKKLDEVGNTDADLQLSGQTLDELSWKMTENGIKIGVFGGRAPVADGHSNISGKSKLPRRRFIPDVGQDYKGPIATEVDRIVADIVSQNVQDVRLSQLTKIKNKTQLYNYLADLFGVELSRAELKLAVYRNQDVLDLLDAAGLIGLI